MLLRVQDLHELNYAHLDLKFANFVIPEDLSFELIDFYSMNVIGK